MAGIGVVVAMTAPAVVLAQPGRDGAPVLVAKPKPVMSRTHPGLARFHARLAALGAGKTDRLTIVQIGDSHTAAEHFAGRLRTVLQQRFGNAGRGLLPAGQPFAWWRPYQIRASQSAGWQVFSSNGVDPPVMPYGLSGHVIRASSPDDAAVLERGEDGQPFAEIEIGYYRRPEGGGFRVIADGAELARIDTRAGATAYERRRLASATPADRIEVRPLGDGPVDLGDWAVYSGQRGVVVSSHGFSGAQVSIIGRWDAAVVARQLSELDPALILLAFGTNEGYAPKKRLADYQATFRHTIEQLRAAAPNASIVVVTGPDANRIPKHCGLPPGDDGPCWRLGGDAAASYDERLGSADKALCFWHTPASYRMVRAAQFAAARAAGVLVWDWFDYQGGYCGATAWQRQGLVLKDRVHLSKAGYEKSADRLLRLLLRGYRAR